MSFPNVFIPDKDIRGRIHTTTETLDSRFRGNDVIRVFQLTQVMKTIQKRYDAVLFDFDGVIGRTMSDNYRAWKGAMASRGIRLGRTEYLLLEGMSVRAIAEHFLKLHRSALSGIDGLARLKEKLYALSGKNISMYPGALRLAGEIKKSGYKLGLVTGGGATRIARALGKNAALFGAIVTADDVKKCKPHPDPYLAAAKILSVKPSRCIAVENAPLGIESAKRAGMFCVAVTSTLAGRYLSGADALIDDVRKLRHILSGPNEFKKGKQT
jgi:beta-phosphoglucomutase